jgi:hypothetical protein
MLPEPVGEALVQVGTDALCQGVVGGVSEQQVVEAEGVLSRELGLVRADQALAHERGQPRRHLPVGGERVDRSAVEDLALDRSPLEHRALARLELVEAGGEKRAQGGRNGDIAFGLACHRRHLGQEERVAAGGAGDPPKQVVVEAVRQELRCLFRRERLEPDGRRPGRAALDQLRPRHAEKEKRGIASEQRGRLDKVQEGLLRPLDVVEQHHQRCLLLEQLAEGPGDLLGARCPVALAQQRADRRRGRRVGGKGLQLLEHLHHRPVGDAVAVGKAAAADRATIDRRQRLCHQTGLAHPASPAIVRSSQRPSERARSQLAWTSASSHFLPTKGAVCGRSGVANRETRR